MAGQIVGLLSLALVLTTAQAFSRQRRQTISFYCPGSSIIKYQDPNNCSNYYECSNSQAYLRQCSVGQVYNPTYQNCGIYDNPPGCVPTSTSSTVSSSGTFSCTYANGLQQDPQDCSSYYRCNNYAPTKEYCGFGLIFNPSTGVCQSGIVPTGCTMPSTSGGTSSTTGSFTCPSSTGTYVDQNDCSVYYTCYNYAPTRYQCNSGYSYDISRGGCYNDFVPSGCGQYASTGSTYTTTFTCPSSTGTYVDQNDCSVYYTCYNYASTRYQCNSGYSYDISRGGCYNDFVPSGCGQYASSGSTYTTTFTCPSSTGTYVDQNDCSVYYTCYNYASTRYQCNSGYSYDISRGGCYNDFVPSGCGQYASTGSATTTTFTCPSSTGTYVDQNDCSVYYTCYNYAPTRYQCNSGYSYDISRGGCYNDFVPSGCGQYASSGSTYTTTFTCPSSTGTYVDQNDCSVYYTCYNYASTRYQCNSGYSYDISRGGCYNDFVPSGCGQYASTGSTSTTTFTCLTSSGTYVDPNDCSAYYICYNYASQRYTCNSGYYYDLARQGCYNDFQPTGCETYSTTTTTFTCPLSTGTYVDQNDCSVYYICYNYAPTRYQCNSGYSYDIARQGCYNDFQPTGCEQYTNTGSTSSTSFQCTYNGYFVDPSDCSAYYYCYNGVSSRYTCYNTGTYYDVSRGACYNDFAPTNCIMSYTSTSTVFTCPATSYNGFYVDPNDCAAYYYCYNGNPLRYTCQVYGTYYDASRGACYSNFYPTGCQIKNLTCQTSTQTFVDPNDCSVYYMCNNYVPIRYSCNAGTYYDVTRGGCFNDFQPVGCQYTQTSVSTSSFTCLTSSGTYVDPNDCSAYYICYNFVPTRYTCGTTGTYYDPARQACFNDFQPTGCQYTGTAVSTTTFTCLTSSGAYVDPNDCSAYYICYNFVPTRYTCGTTGTYYDPARQACFNDFQPTGCQYTGTAVSTTTFQCTASLGIFQDPLDCSTYYTCDFFVATKRTCPTNYFFDPTTTICSQGINPGGCIMPVTSDRQTSFTCPSAVTGYYVDPFDCSGYYYCSNGVSTARNVCPAGQYFVTSMGTCASNASPTGCTIVTNTGSTSSFTCPAANGVFVDPNDCSAYYICTNFVPSTRYTCNAGYNFDVTRGNCFNDFNPTGCTLTSNVGTTSFTCLTSSGAYVDPNDCSAYYICYNFVPTRYTCPTTGTYYDPARQGCFNDFQPTGCPFTGSVVTTTSFTCLTSSGAYVDPNDCSAYYICYNFVPTRYTCPTTGTYYDPARQGCFNDFQPTGCPFTGSVVTTTSFTCLTSSGAYVDPNDCSAYYICYNFVPTRYTCPTTGTYYDPARQGCFNDFQPTGCPFTGSVVTTTSFNCPAPTGSYVDPYDCSAYYICNNYAATRIPCNQGSYFDQTRGYCATNITPVGCVIVGGGSTLTSPAVGPFTVTCPITANATLVPHPSICNAFFICGNGVPSDTCIFCGEGTYYDVSAMTCLADYSVDYNLVCPGRTLMIPHEDKTIRQIDGTCWPYGDQPNPYTG